MYSFLHNWWNGRCDAEQSFSKDILKLKKQELKKIAKPVDLFESVSGIEGRIIVEDEIIY